MVVALVVAHAPEALPTSLQESLLAMLSTHPQGVAVALQVKPEHFDAPYQEIATGLLDYWRQWGRAPGQAHLDDIYGVALQKGERATRNRRLLVQIIALAEGLNVDYLIRRTSDFVEWQTIKAGLLRASEIAGSGGPDNIAAVKQVLHGALRSAQAQLDAGTFLKDTDRTLRFLDHRPTIYEIGIREFDQVGFGAPAGEILLYIGPKGSGKTWFCVHMGRRCLIERGRVLHISLEMDEEHVMPRYLQSIFSAAWSGDPYVRSVFELDDLGRMVGWRLRQRTPNLVFTDPNIRKILRTKLQSWGARFGNHLVIKSFPSGQLTIPQLVAYLDYMEAIEKFIPTMLIIDYPGLMKLDRRDIRMELGRTFVELRGLLKERNLAGVMTAQGQRGSIGAKRVRSTNVAEDISTVFTAGNVLTYSQTEQEKRLGLARLFVEHARYTAGGQEVIITQAYTAGQYVLESAYKPSSYWEHFKVEDDDQSDAAD